MGAIYTNPPQSRNEAIIESIIEGTEYTAPPQSRMEDLLIGLKETIETGSDSTAGYPQYAATEMEEVAGKIENYINTIDNPIIIGFNTDQHIVPNASSEWGMTVRNEVTYGLRTLRDLSKRFPFNAVVLGGDSNGSSAGTIAAMQASALYVVDQMYGVEEPLDFLVGNHEGGQDNETITRGQVFKSHMTDSVQNKVLTTVDYSSCYYDDQTSEVRFIFLDSFPRSSVNYTTTDVNTVLAGMLSTIPSGYKAIIFSHHPLDENLPQVADRKGWNNPTHCHATLQAYKDKIIACFCGHIHNNLYVEDLDGVTFVATTCAGWSELNDGSTRTAGNADATAYDVFVIDQSEKKIYAIRYGNGSDREISYEHESQPRGNILADISWTDGKRINSSGEVVDGSGYSTTDIIDDINVGDVLYFSDGTLPLGHNEFTVYSDDGTTTSTVAGISDVEYGATFDPSKMYFQFLNSNSAGLTDGACFYARVLSAKNPSDSYHSRTFRYMFGETTFWSSGYVKSFKVCYDEAGDNQYYSSLAKIRFTFPTDKKSSLDIRVNEPFE